MGTWNRTERSAYRRADRSACNNGLRRDAGFTLVEVLICTLVLTTGMLAIAALLAVTTQMQIGAREAARSMRLAQEQVDELLKMDFEDDAQVAVGGSLTANNADHFVVNPPDANGTPLEGITVRWAVNAGPLAAGQPTDTRIVTVRVVNLRAQQYRQTDLATIIRSWQ